MSDPQRRDVRVRRSPKYGVFLAIGAVLGALVAIVAVNVTPPDPTVPKVQTIGFLIVLLAPVGAAVTGLVALALDRLAERRSRIVEAERIAPPAVPRVEPGDAQGVAAVQAAETPDAAPEPGGDRPR